MGSYCGLSSEFVQEWGLGFQTCPQCPLRLSSAVAWNRNETAVHCSAEASLRFQQVSDSGWTENSFCPFLSIELQLKIDTCREREKEKDRMQERKKERNTKYIRSRWIPYRTVACSNRVANDDSQLFPCPKPVGVAARMKAKEKSTIGPLIVTLHHFLFRIHYIWCNVILHQ